jgi:hypothetical protein
MSSNQPIRIKRWHTSHLLSNLSIRSQRIQKIEELGRTLACFPQSTFQTIGDTLILEQQRIKRAPIPAYKELQPALYRLAEDIDQMESMGFIHGDIVYKNTLWDGRTLWLVDLEPDLRQNRTGQPCWMVTPPWVAHGDLVRDQITPMTDRIGFAALCARLQHGLPDSMDYRALYKQRYAEDCFLPWGISDARVANTKFVDLVGNFP